MGSRINKTRIQSENNLYNRAKEEARKTLEEMMAFSFKHLNFNNKFTISECDENYFDRFIKRLKDLGFKRMEDFMDENKYNEVLRNHRIDWDKRGVTEDGFNLSFADDVLDEPWQFSISGNEHGRVHGFIIGNIFYIVWLDPEHNLDIGIDGNWEVTPIRETPRSKLLEEIFSYQKAHLYLHNSKDIDIIRKAYEEECESCEEELKRLWYHCVICNESNEDSLIEWNEVHICYKCLKEMKKVKIEEIEESA